MKMKISGDDCMVLEDLDVLQGSVSPGSFIILPKTVSPRDEW